MNKITLHNIKIISIVRVSIYLIILSNISFAFIPEYPPKTIMEQTTESDIIVVGRTIDCDLFGEASSPHCESTIKVDRYLKGKGDSILIYTNTIIPPSLPEPWDCYKYRGKRYLVFLSIQNGKAHEIQSYNEDYLNKNEEILLKAIRKYISIDSIKNNDDRLNSIASWIVDCLEIDRLRDEGLICLWNGNLEDNNEYKIGVLNTYKTLFSSRDKNRIINVLSKLSDYNEFEMNLLKIAYEWDTVSVENKLVSFLKKDINCTHYNNLSDELKEEFEYQTAIYRIKSIHIMKMLSNICADDSCKLLFAAIMHKSNCDDINYFTKKFVEIFSKKIK